MKAGMVNEIHDKHPEKYACEQQNNLPSINMKGNERWFIPFHR